MFANFGRQDDDFTDIDSVFSSESKKRESSGSNSSVETEDGSAVKKCKIYENLGYPYTVVFGLEAIIGKVPNKGLVNQDPYFDKHVCLNEEYSCWPRFKMLLDYLLEKDCNIMFFGDDNESQNIPLMRSYLVSLFGEENYKLLVEKGQFDVFSFQHMTLGYKSLKPLLQTSKGQTMDNTILIGAACWVDADEREILFHCGVNFVSRCLGLFITYFEDFQSIINNNYNNNNNALMQTSQERVSLRSFVGNLDINKNVKWDHHPKCDDEYDLNLVRIGLAHIRKSFPDEIFYLNINCDEEMPVDQIRSLEYITETLYKLRSGRKSVFDGDMILFQRQFSAYFAPYYRRILTEVEWNKLTPGMKKALKRGVLLL